MDFSELIQEISGLLGIKLNGYKPAQLKRRLEHLIHSSGFTNYRDYYQALKVDVNLQNAFMDKFTINVTEFFRNTNIFEQLANKILPDLLSRKKKLKIWSAACSIGAEPYSIAIILNELTPEYDHYIDATDIDEKILNLARQGSYKFDYLKNIPPQVLNKYFEKNGDLFNISPVIKKKVNFRKHDLLTDIYEYDYDLIMCRNVTIYFTKESQAHVYKGFWHSLVPGGILFTGATECILNYRELGFTSPSPWFYKKVV